MITVGEACNRRVVVIERTDTVVEAARMMRAHHVGSLVIVDQEAGERRPVGIITDRDIVVGVVATASPYLDTLLVGEIATERLVTATEDESLADALERMRANGVRRVPVVDSRGTLAGILAFDDLLARLSEQLSDLGALVTRELEDEKLKRRS